MKEVKWNEMKWYKIKWTVGKCSKGKALVMLIEVQQDGLNKNEVQITASKVRSSKVEGN